MVAKLCAQHGILLGHVGSIVKKKRLRLIRDKTLFHLDKRGVKYPRGVWKEAALTGKELQDAFDASLRLLCLLHKVIRGAEYLLPYYDGSDATKIAEHAYKHGLLSTGEPVDPALAALYA